ncbi:MAG: Uma2 family endonuclease [Thermostichus sp. DG02_5_bins_236]
MVYELQKIQKLTFEEFLDWYPNDGSRYELIDGEVVEMRLIGDAISRRWREHEELAGLIARKLDREIERLSLFYFISKSCCIKPKSAMDTDLQDVIILDRQALQKEPLWKIASTIMYGSSTPLVVEISSTNWQDDYARKLEDHEAMGIREYWIVNSRALGGKRFIGDPKQPTVSIYQLTNGRIKLSNFVRMTQFSLGFF